MGAATTRDGRCLTAQPPSYFACVCARDDRNDIGAQYSKPVERIRKESGKGPAICIEVAWVLTPLPSEDEPWPRLYGIGRPRPERTNQLIKLPASVRHNLRLAAVACQVEISELGEIAIRHYLSRLSQARVHRG